MTSFIPIDDVSRVAETRRLAMSVAREEGLDDAAIGNAGLVATEIATNLWKHAQGGEVHVGSLSQYDQPGVDIVSIDRGPGMADFSRCLEDGYSSVGTPGTGLGTILRHSRVFDGYSEPGKGTVVLARIYGSDVTKEKLQRRFLVGFAGRPISGEEISGDSWSVREDGPDVAVMIADGLGHGVLAADASRAAANTFGKSPETAPSALLDRVHRALRGTRGAAVAISSLNLNQGVVRYAGIGNISGVVVSALKAQNMISHHGTAGHEAKHFQEFLYPFPTSAVLVMHSDGLATSWNLSSYPGLVLRHPAIIAGVLYRDWSRNRDDVCVVVLKDRTP